MNKVGMKIGNLSFTRYKDVGPQIGVVAYKVEKETPKNYRLKVIRYHSFYNFIGKPEFIMRKKEDVQITKTESYDNIVKFGKESVEALKKSDDISNNDKKAIEESFKKFLESDFEELYDNM